MASLLLLRAILFFVGIFLVLSFQTCSDESGGGTCPSGNTCCKRAAQKSEDDSGSTTACIPNDLGSYNATCCDDGGKTGCGMGYQCIENNLCLAVPSSLDPLVQVLPRYKLCQGQSQSLFGVPVLEGSGNTKFVYYSSHGDLKNLNTSESVSRIQMVLIVIHGADRKADDYFCSSMAAVKQQSQYPTDSIVLLAPRYPNMQDTDLEISNGGAAVRWGDGADPSGTWRYGQSATYPFDLGNSISSFHALDLLLNALNIPQLPSLRKVSIVGHSSGGQFVQRWSLMTSHWNESLFHGVVANPSSYAYLSTLRFIDSQWKLPASKTCLEYNKWAHGLDSGGNYSVPYVANVIEDLGIHGLIQRFQSRHMTYLAGSLDVCNVSGNESGWCDSHGLETTCSDLLQGRTRLERHQHYIEMLTRQGVPFTRAIVPGVGHDHSLMFNSKEGLVAIFGSSVSETSAKQ